MVENHILHVKDALKQNSKRYAICYELHLQVYAITFSALDDLSDKLHNYFKTLIAKDVYVGLSCQSKHWLVPILLGLWKCRLAVAVMEQNNDSNIIEKLKLNFVIYESDISIKHRWKTKFTIMGCQFCLYALNEKTKTLELDMCYALTTSGSTGKPKMVQVPWSCIYPNAIELSNLFLINETDVIFSTAPFTFDPFFIELFFSLTKGAMLYFYYNTPLNVKQNVTEILDETSFKCEMCTIPKPKMTVLQITPSLFKLLYYDNSRSVADLSSLRVLILGGEQFPSFKFKLPLARVFNIYGITELSCWSFVQEVVESPRRVSIGQPLSGIVYKIEDGELLIGSENRKCLVEDDNPGLLPKVVYRKTGDIVEIDPETGQLYFISRKYEMVKKFGNKISIEKINKLLEDCDFKSYFVVFEGSMQVIGLFFVEENSPQEYEVINLKSFPQLGEMYVRLSDLDRPDITLRMKHLPLTRHGKTDISYLREILRKEMCRRPFEDTGKTFEHIWCEILGLRVPELEKSFLESGGNSILALKFIARLDALDIKVPSLLVSQLLGSNSFHDCCKLVLDLNMKKDVSGEDVSAGYNRVLDGTDMSNLPVQSESLEKGPPSAVARCKLNLKWSFNMGKCVDAPPKLISLNKELYVAVGSHSSQLSMVACDSGKELWSAYLGDRIESGIAVSPDNERLYTGCYDKYIYCLSAREGTTIWKFQTGGMVKSTPCISVDGTLVYCGSYDRKLYCLAAEDGTLIASILLGGSILATSILAGNILLIGSLDGGCKAVEARTLRPVWCTFMRSPIFSNPCLVDLDERVLFAEVEGRVHCFNTLTGYKDWEIQCGGNIFSGLTPIPDTTGLVTFGCHDRHLYLLQTAPKPNIVWKILLESPIACAPAVAHGLIACSASLGILYIVGIEGSIKAHINLAGELFSAPLFFENFVYLGCRDDNLVCVNVQKYS